MVIGFVYKFSLLRTKLVCISLTFSYKCYMISEEIKVENPHIYLESFLKISKGLHSGIEQVSRNVVKVEDLAGTYII